MNAPVSPFSVFDWPNLRLSIVGDGADGVTAILEALAAGARENRQVILPRNGPPQLESAGFAVMLETSGTTGPAKWMRHDPARLLGRLRVATANPQPANPQPARWLLTYHPCSFAGLQVILTAAWSGATLITAVLGADVAALSALAVAEHATHISGSPSFWRGFLMACPPPYPPLQTVTLGGEAADQALLDHLRSAFPEARLRHIYASTEAGALFSVADGREGFPVRWLDDGDSGGVEGEEGIRLQLRDGELWALSPRAAIGIGDSAGWSPTGDLAVIRGDRVVFCGRKDGWVNVGGVKVSPEEAEALILAVEGVADALVTAQPSPLTGNLLTATIVPRPNADAERLRQSVRDALAILPPAARPRIVTFADAVPLSASGKKSRTVL